VNAAWKKYFQGLTCAYRTLAQHADPGRCDPTVLVSTADPPTDKIRGFVAGVRVSSKGRFAALLVLGVSLAVHAAAARNLLFFCSDMIHGDGAVARLVPGLRYWPMRVPRNELADRHLASARLAADFAQVYFPAQDFSRAREAYSLETTDPWSRPSRYAPLVHRVCAATICRLPYGVAALAHLGAQYVLFAFSLAYAFYVLKLGSVRFAVALTLVNAGLFLTPVGLTFLERGQFTLYVGLAYLWLLLGIYCSRPLYFALAALFGFVKWTALPGMFVVVALWLAISPDRRTLAERVRRVLPMALVGAALLAPFPVHAFHFLSGLADQENSFVPEGLSLVRVLPRWAVKALPLVLVALGGLRARRAAAAELPQIFPFVLGALVLMNVYPTLAYDYTVPCLFAAIPFALEWGRRAESATSSAWALPMFFLVFASAASLAGTPEMMGQSSEIPLIWLHVLTAAGLLCLPLRA